MAMTDVHNNCIVSTASRISSVTRDISFCLVLRSTLHRMSYSGLCLWRPDRTTFFYLRVSDI